MVHAIAQSDALEQHASPLTHRRVVAFGDDRRQGHVLLGGERGEQVEELEDEPDVVAPELGQLLVTQALVVEPGDRDGPRVADSSAPTMCTSVLFPEPDGPMIATISPSSITRSTPSRARTSIRPWP
jgi:hypothetical protein